MVPVLPAQWYVADNSAHSSGAQLHFRRGDGLLARRLQVVLVVAVALSSAFVSTSCGVTTQDPQTSESAVVLTANQQDAVFAYQLIELSEQLIVITDVLAAKTDQPKKQAELAEIERVANERIVLAKRWLQLWARTAIEAPAPPGTLSEIQMDALIESNGAALVRAIESAATTQRDGTTAISEAEVEFGENTAAISGARQILELAETDRTRLLRIVSE